MVRLHLFFFFHLNTTLPNPPTPPPHPSPLPREGNNYFKQGYKVFRSDIEKAVYTGPLFLNSIAFLNDFSKKINTSNTKRLESASQLVDGICSFIWINFIVCDSDLNT